jgi:hypothetical protein
MAARALIPRAAPPTALLLALVVFSSSENLAGSFTVIARQMIGSAPLAALVLERENEYKISRNRLLVRVAGSPAF